MNKLLYLSRENVESIGLSMIDIIDALDDMFKEKGAGNVEMPPKPGIHPRKDAFIHAMPAYIPKSGAAGIKWISGYPDNHLKNLPYITGLLILNDPETGVPICVMDATWITAQRTGAATAVAARYLARPDSSSVGILACGVQGKSNLEALACIFDLKQVKVYDINPEKAEAFAIEMGTRLQLDIEVVTEPGEAVENLDLIVTSGPILKEPLAVIQPDWLAEGVFASPVDFDTYWSGDALQKADKLATDDHEQMTYYRGEGYFKTTPEPYADLGEIAAGKKAGRQNNKERIICINLGLALDDMATAILVYKNAIKRGIGTLLAL